MIASNDGLPLERFTDALPIWTAPLLWRGEGMIPVGASEFACGFAT